MMENQEGTMDMNHITYQKTTDIMKIYQKPLTEIMLLNLSRGVMQDDNIDFDDAVSVLDGEIQTNTIQFFEDDDAAWGQHQSGLWDD